MHIYPIILKAFLAVAAAVVGVTLLGRVDATTNCTVTDSSLDQEEQAFVGLLNAYRQQNGMAPLVLNPALTRDATWMVTDLVASGSFSHTDSLGRSAFQRSVDCGYAAGASENLAEAFWLTSAQAAFEAWKSSPSHKANMLFPYYTEVGIAHLVKPGSVPTWYWATEFGAGAGAPPATSTPSPVGIPTITAVPSSVPPGATVTPPAVSMRTRRGVVSSLARD